MRKLATIRYIHEILPIEGADNIEIAVVDGWNCVVKKGNFQSREIIVYIEIDSFIPIHPYFEYLRKSSYRKMDEEEGFRLKTVRLRGVLSQGLVVSLKDLIKEGLLEDKIYITGFDDVTQKLGIKLYEPPIPSQLSGKMKGNFPSFIPKTDELRVQNLDYHKLINETYYVTEKLDGSSITIYLKEDIFGVCSRNIDLLEDEDNTFWKTVRKLDIENLLRKQGLNDISLQGELIGEGIQGNKYKLKGHHIKFFNVYDIVSGKRFELDKLKEIIVYGLGLETVPVLSENFKLPLDRKELLVFAEGKSQLYDTEREGVVIRTQYSSDISFKVISNKFLLKED
jgi:RNA ligase (TIGR02306 family)